MRVCCPASAFDAPLPRSALFAGADVWRESRAPELRLHGVSPDTLRTLVACVYTGQLPVTPRTVAPLLASATQLALLPVAAALRDLLRARLGPASALATAALAAAHGDAALAEAAMACAACNFAAVLAEDAAGFAALPPERLAALLASDALAAAAEADVLRALLAWASAEEADSEASAGQPATPPHDGVNSSQRRRAHALEALLPLVRLRQVPRGQLAEAAQAAEVAGASGAAALLRRVAEPERHRIGTAMADADAGCAEARACVDVDCCAACAAARSAAGAWTGGAAARWATPRASAPLRLLAMGGHDGGWISHRGCEVFDVRTEQWTAAPPLPFAVSFLAAARAGAGADGAPPPLLAVAGGNFAACACQSVALPASPAATDPDAAPQPAVLPWSPAPAPPTPRVHAALASFGGDQLFLLGGRAGSNIELDVVERYDCAAAAWSGATQGVPRMRAPRASLGAAAVGDTLFAVGGQAGRETFASVDVLDLHTGAWTAAPPMAAPRKYGAVAALRGCVVAVGGMNAARERTCLAEALDPREGRWRALAPLPAPRSSAAAAVAAGCLYLAGGNDGEATHGSCFRYDPAADAWQQVAPMSVPRTGAALVAL